MLAVPFNESFDSSKKQPLTPSTAYKKSRGNIVSPKCLTPRNNAIKHLREMIAKERMEAKLRMQALPNPFQIIHLDI